MKTIELVFFDAGGGHRSAANALSEVVRQEGRPWDMRMMNLQESLDSLDIFRKVTGIRLQDLYNLMLRRGWTLGSSQMLKAMHGIIRLYHPAQVRLLHKHWSEKRPDLVVSVVPNFNRALYQSVRGALPATPYVTILTDLADYPPNFWIERNQQQFFICGTNRAYDQAIQMGHSSSHVFRTSGMILHPKFYETKEVDRERDRVALGLDPDLPTILVMFGGEGSKRMVDIVESLSASDLKVQVVAIAGKNRQLEERLRSLHLRIPISVHGFTRDVPRLMLLSDVFIGKPGPGSISEAITMGLPVLIERSIWTLPQERYNTKWVQETGVGIAVDDFKKEVAGAIRRLLDPATRAALKLALDRHKNRAVFEIPQILDQILSRA